MDFSQIIPERYRVAYDSKGDRWQILDTWHPQIKNISDLDQNIPEDSPAVKIVSGTEMNAIIGEMIKRGFLEKIIKRGTESNIINNKVKVEEKPVQKEKFIFENSEKYRMVDFVNDLKTLIEEAEKKHSQYYEIKREKYKNEKR